MLVYRIEDANGRGPYWETYGTPCRKMSDSHSWGPARYTHPTMHMYDEGKHICGCPTLELLKTWFRGYRSLLRRLGYKMCVFEVDAKHIPLQDEYQLMFPRSQSTLLKKVRIP